MEGSIKQEEGNYGIFSKRMKLAEIGEEITNDENGRGSSGNGAIVMKRFFQSPLTIPVIWPEVWEIILKDLPSTDFLTVINTCPEWSELLHSKKSTKLLPLILPIVFEYLSLQTIIQGRLVNKSSFKSIVDSVLLKYSSDINSIFSHDPSSRMDNVNSLCSKVELLRNQYRVTSLSQVRKLIRSTPINPFLTGNLAIQCGQGALSDALEVRLSLSILTDQLGRHVSSFTLSMKEGRNEISAYMLYFFLSELPNLKHLCLDALIPTEAVSSYYEMMWMIPTLPLLESFCVKSFRGVNNTSQDFNIITPFICRFGEQLKLFSCGGRVLGIPNLNRGFSYHTPNITHLKVSSVDEPSMLFLGEVMSWKHVEQLHISGEGPVFPSFSAEMVLQVISNFRGTLKNLELLVTVNPLNRADRLAVRNMRRVPNLKKLLTPIQNGREHWFYLFLKKSCKQLEELQFQIQDGEQLLEEDKVGVRKAFGLLPKVKKIVFWFNDKPKVIMYR